MKRRVIRYHRGHLDSTLAAARKLADTATRYVFATAGGYTIDRRPPPFGQTHYLVTRHGVQLVERITSMGSQPAVQ
jgi:hypothetical protein